MQNKTEALIPGNIYHVYNRANGSEKLFLIPGNYEYFLKKYWENIGPIADTFCYCLMPNHFHFVIKIKNMEELKLTLPGLETLEGLAISKKLSKQFSNLFNGYTQAFNKQNQRMGSLFMQPYKRKLITSPAYLQEVICYIHNNPLSANLSKDLFKWPYNSYREIINGKTNNLSVSETINVFGDMEHFIKKHVGL